MPTMGNTSVASSWREFSCLPKAYNFGKENQLKLQFVINFVIDSGLGLGEGKEGERPWGKDWVETGPPASLSTGYVVTRPSGTPVSLPTAL